MARRSGARPVPMDATAGLLCPPGRSGPTCPDAPPGPLARLSGDARPTVRAAPALGGPDRRLDPGCRARARRLPPGRSDRHRRGARDAAGGRDRPGRDRLAAADPGRSRVHPGRSGSDSARRSSSSPRSAASWSSFDWAGPRRSCRRSRPPTRGSSPSARPRRSLAMASPAGCSAKPPSGASGSASGSRSGHS